ncbi:MAG: SDR family oxidoreductase [Mycobacterium leprae]
MTEQSRVLVVGSGYLAGHAGQRLRDAGHAVTLSSRRRPSTPETRNLDWVAVDVSDRDCVRALVNAARPDAVVTVHGPSDITWCEANPNDALTAHRDGAQHLAEVLDGRRVLMISTDNVFPGRKDSYAESDPTEPANAYGRAKLAAEDRLLKTGNALVLRVSLVYGWDRAGLRPNFFTMCAHKIATGRPVTVPDDHWNSPVLVDDVASWSAALLGSDHTGVVHLGGPRRLSRVAWARHIAERFTADPDLVKTLPRRTTAYACRPRNACLHSERARCIRELEGLEPMDVFEACTKLIALEGTNRD